MSNELLSKYIMHFQMRIILQNSPNPLFDIYMSFLNRVYCGLVCNKHLDKVCLVVHYLLNNLPVECKSIPEEEPFKILDCKFYRFKFRIYQAAGIGGTTITKDEQIFEYNKGFILDYKKAILSVIGTPSPNVTYSFDAEIKYTIDSDWEEFEPLQQINLL